jgi:hypothetical protein
MRGERKTAGGFSQQLSEQMRNPFPLAALASKKQAKRGVRLRISSRRRSRDNTKFQSLDKKFGLKRIIASAEPPG